MVNVITGQAVINVGSTVMTKKGAGRVTFLGETFIEVQFDGEAPEKLGPSEIQFVVLERNHSTIPSTVPAPIYSELEVKAGYAKYHPTHDANRSGMKAILVKQPAFLPSATNGETVVSGIPTIPLAFKEPAPYAETTILVTAPTHSAGYTPAPQQ